MIRLIYNLYCSGNGLEFICNELNRLGYNPRRSNEFTKSTISHILANPVYIGKIKYTDKADIKTLHGAISIKIPAGMNSGKTLRLRDLGLPKKEGGYGDLNVKAKIVIPKNLTEKQIALYKELSEKYLNAGYKQIIEERQAAYKAGNSTKLPK